MDPDAIRTSDASDFKLGDWWVRPQRNELERAEEHQHVEARSMEVLVCLGRHAPGVVSKERLLDEVWSDSPYVGEDVISHAIWELRKALGDSARQPVYIQTVPRKGYRLVAEILRPQGASLPMEGVRIGHYDLKGELGRGSMGVIFKAVDRRLGRTVAIKFLAPELTRDPKACQRFEREARLAASLDHPNLATVHEVGETSAGHRYLVQACYSGGSLKDRLAAGPLAVEEAIRLLHQLIAGLRAAHEREIVHRDIKPANLLLDEHGTLKICDFGIAKLLGATDLTRTGATLGTPAYKSPEQTQGQAVDHRTDLWSVGVVFFELLTGRRPFDGEYEHAVVHSILSIEPRAPEEAHGRPLPEPLRRFIARALAKDPAERFQSAEEMALALDRLEDRSPSARRWRGARRWLLVGAGIVAVVLLLWAVPAWRTSSRVETGAREELAIRTVESKEGQDHLAQGRRLWLRGNYLENLEEVRRHFDRAVALLPESPEALGHLAAFLAERYAATGTREDREQALELIARALAIDRRRSSLSLAARAWILLREGELTQAERLARDALRLDPECGRGELCDLAYLWLGEALWMQGRAEEALAILERGLQVGGGNLRCRLKRAQLFEKTGEKRKAEDEYLEVLELDKEQSTALEGLATFYVQTERLTEALPIYHRLYQTTLDPLVLNNIGYIYYSRKLWDDAIQVYKDADRAFKEKGIVMPSPMLNIGDIHMELGDKEEARKYYLQALELYEALEEPALDRQAQRAVCLAKLGRFDEAEQEIRKRLQQKREEDAPNLLVYAARIYALKGDRETLFDLARRAIAMGRPPAFFTDDVAFKPYREDREYRLILEPNLILSGSR